MFNIIFVKKHIKSGVEEPKTTHIQCLKLFT